MYITILVYKLRCSSLEGGDNDLWLSKKWMEGLTTGESIAAEIRLGIVSGEILSDTLLTERIK